MNGLLVHEWIAQRGGSEKVLDRFAATFPDAPILCSWNDAPGRYEAGRVRETWLAKTPLRRSKAAALPFLPLAWRNQAVDADWVLVSSHLFAHHVTLKDKQVPKLLYVHSPARYIWVPELDPRGAHPLAQAVGNRFKSLDARRAKEATSVVANSAFVAERIRRTWGVEADVIHPPVDVNFILEGSPWTDSLGEDDLQVLRSLPSDFLLGASRFVSYKRLDLVIKAGKASGLPVVLAGAGPDEQQLRQYAYELGVEVHFVIAPSDPLLYALYESSLVFAFPPIEDFGIMPVEAMATGTPVIVNSVGGARESVKEGIGGSVFLSEDDSELRRAVNVAAAIHPDVVRGQARQFDATQFDAAVRAWVQRETGSR